MKSLKELELHVPHLGVKCTKQAIGGYQDGYNGGMLNASVIVADRSWDDFWPFGDPSSRDSRSDFDSDSIEWGQATGGSGNVDYYSEQDDNDVSSSGITFDCNMSSEDIDKINDAINSLPEGLRPTNIHIIIDPELLQSLKHGEYANGCYLHQSQLAPKNDGTYYIVEEDTIVLKGTDVDDLEGLLFEECLHCWQNKNCELTGATDTNNTSAKEFQVDVIQTLMDIQQDRMVSSIGLDSILPILYDIQDSQYNISDYMSDMLSQISQEQWNCFYEEWSQANHYSAINDTYYDWKWDELLELVFPDSQNSESSGSAY